jgi:cytochrome c553
MSKVSLGLSIFCLMLTIPAKASAQAGTTVAQRAEGCAGSCHGPSLIAQQRLDRAGWTREVDKMIGWGATVPATDKDAFINYFTAMFNPSRPRPNTSKAVPEGKAKDVFQTACMSCHDDRPMAGLRLDRAGWTREIDKMIRWGAWVPASRKEELIEYLMAGFSR